MAALGSEHTCELPISWGLLHSPIECAEVPGLLQIHLHFYLLSLSITPACQHWGCFESKILCRREEQPRQLEGRGERGNRVFLGGGGFVLPPDRSGKAILIWKRISLETMRILCDSLIVLNSSSPKSLMPPMAKNSKSQLGLQTILGRGLQVI